MGKEAAPKAWIGTAWKNEKYEESMVSGEILELSQTQGTGHRFIPSRDLICERHSAAALAFQQELHLFFSLD